MFRCIGLSLLCFGINKLDWFITKQEKVFNGRVVLKRGIFGWKIVYMPCETCRMITYLYNSRKYIYVSYTGVDPVWPPTPVAGPSFTIPIKRATGAGGVDYTAFVKRLAGPRGDFHGQSIQIQDVIPGYPIVIESILGITKTYGPLDIF
jgi:hypothetical protein